MRVDTKVSTRIFYMFGMQIRIIISLYLNAMRKYEVHPMWGVPRIFCDYSNTFSYLNN